MSSEELDEMKKNIKGMNFKKNKKEGAQKILAMWKINI